MKRKEWKKLLIMVWILSILLSGCGSSKSTSQENRADVLEGAVKSSEAGYDTGNTEEYATQDAVSEDKKEESADSQTVMPQDTNKKLIKNVNMSIETKEFDSFMETMTEQITTVGGYVQSSDTQGIGYDYTGTRYSNVVVRIPADQLYIFLGKVSEIGNVTSKYEGVEDVTFQYTDIESHKKALQVEQDRLLELLAKAEGIEAIIAIETRLSEIRYQLEYYESQIRIYDNQIEYSTVTLQITEVERITPVKEQSIVSKIKTGFTDNLFHIGVGFKNFFIWFLSNIPNFILLGFIVVIIILLFKKLFKKKMVRKSKEKAQESENENEIRTQKK